MQQRLYFLRRTGHLPSKLTRSGRFSVAPHGHGSLRPGTDGARIAPRGPKIALRFTLPTAQLLKGGLCVQRSADKLHNLNAGHEYAMILVGYAPCSVLCRLLRPV